MTIDELYEKLQDPDFQDTATGQLFFPAYMYLYDVAHEAEIERRLQGIKEGLHRPSHYLDGVAGRDAEVAQWSQATLDKLGSQYRTVLTDCGLWNQEQLVPATHVSDAFKSHYITAGEGWFLEACFLPVA